MAARWLAAIELERAVDVSDGNEEEGTNEPVPAPAVDPPHGGVMAHSAVTGHHVRFVGPRQQQGKFVHVELVVGVRVEDEVLRRLAKPGAQCLAVALVGGMPHQANLRMSSGARIHPFGRPIGRPVVNHDDVEFGAVAGGDSDGVLDGLGDVLLLVEGRKNEGDRMAPGPVEESTDGRRQEAGSSSLAPTSLGPDYPGGLSD